MIGPFASAIAGPVAAAITQAGEGGQSLDSAIRALFANGEQGAWYDPGDFTRYMAGGPNLFPDPDWATLGGWEVASNATIAVSGGELIVTATNTNPTAGYRLTTVIGKQYEVQITLAADAMTGNTFIGAGSGGDDGWTASLANNNIGSTLGRYSLVFTATTTDTRITIFGSTFAIAGETFRVTRPVVRELTAINTATLFQDAAGTTPVTAVGQSVGKILDKSGRGNHATQGTSPARPMLQQDGNGSYYLAFDGVDDYLRTTFPNLGSNVTIGRSIPGTGASILTGQTIGAGNWDDSTSHCALVVINRALTGPETALLTEYLNMRAGL